MAGRADGNCLWDIVEVRIIPISAAFTSVAVGD